MYNSYEEYMRSVLGYPYNNRNYYDDTYRGMPMNNVDCNEMENCYPEIYKIVRPMVTSTCQMYFNQTITKETVEEITMKIYTNIEPQENRSNEELEQRSLKNGDVINPNAKRENREDRNKKTNYLLKDLIKILVINELLGGNRPNNPNRPPMPPPPPRPSQGPGGGYPPQMRQF